MNQKAYLYNTIDPKTYRFTSEGKRTIVKLVEFTPTGQPNMFNLGFGDLLPDGKMDDKTISDNGDMKKVFATVIQIVIDFTAKYPFLKIFFSGSSPGRTKMYCRILKTYYAAFSPKFRITGLIEQESEIIEVDYDPVIFNQWLAFFVERKTYI